VSVLDPASGGGSDAVRLAFNAADRFGAARPFATGSVTLDGDGPGVLVGDNRFDLAPSDGVGAVWVKVAADCQHGRLHITASHPTLGKASVDLDVVC
jgi:hypothetical protein